METPPQAKEYHRIKNRLLKVNLIFSFAILLVIVTSGFALWLRSHLLNICANTFILNGIYMAVLGIIFYILGFPLEFYEEFVLEHRFNLSNQSLAGYLKDNIKKSLISFAVSLAAIEFLYLFLEKFTNIWWILAALGWFVLTVLLAKITPAVLIPLFYKYVELKDAELRNKIFELFSSAGAKLKDVYMIDFSAKTKKANAAVAGFGRGRRVILTDNLIKDFSHEEILSVVAHELGHYKNKDTIKIISFGFMVSIILFFLCDIVLKKIFPFFGYASLADIAGLPLFCLIMLLFGLLALPLQNGFIRSLETRADLYSLKAAKAPGAFISMMEKLAKINLAELEPSRFMEIMFYDHPPIAKRIQSAKRYK